MYFPLVKPPVEAAVALILALLWKVEIEWTI